MRLVDLLETTILLELKVVGNKKNLQGGEYFFVNHDKIMIMDDDFRAQRKELLDFVENLLTDNDVKEFIELLDDELADKHDIVDFVAERIPSSKRAEAFVFLAHERPKQASLLASEEYHMVDLNRNKIIRKVMRQLGIDMIDYHDRNGNEVTIFSDIVDMKTRKGDLPDFLYHGTSLKRAFGVALKGLRPRPEQTNWKKQGILHHDKVFGATDIEEAVFHSILSARNDESIPVIFKFRVPDKNKLVPDYDVASVLGDEEFYYSHYPDIDTPKEFVQNPKAQKRWHQFTSFGYAGNILPGNIVEWYVAEPHVDSMYEIETSEDFYGPFQNFGEMIWYLVNNLEYLDEDVYSWIEKNGLVDEFFPDDEDEDRY